MEAVPSRLGPAARPSPPPPAIHAAPTLTDLPSDALALVTHGALDRRESFSLRAVSRALRDHMRERDRDVADFAPRTPGQLRAALARFPGLVALDLRAAPTRLDPDLLREAVARLPRLERVEGVPATDAHVAALEGARLRGLSLRQVGGRPRALTDAGLEPLRGMPLERAHLLACEAVGDEGMEVFRDMRSLTDVRVTRARGLGPKGLAALCTAPLERLDLRGSGPFDDAGVAPLAGLRLTDLTVTGKRLSGKGLLVLRGMPLRRLDLDCLGLLFPSEAALGSEVALGERLDADGLVRLNGLPIESLSLGGVLVDGAILSHLIGLPLKELTLDWSPRLAGEGAEPLGRLHLQRLRLQDVPEAAAADVAGLLSRIGLTPAPADRARREVRATRVL